MNCLCCNENSKQCGCSRGKCSSCKNCCYHCICGRRNDEITSVTAESIDYDESYLRRIQQLENELSQVKRINRSLMEENEAFQLLLHEKTMEGKFMLNPIMQRNDSYSKKKREKVTNGVSKDEGSSSQNDDHDIFKSSDLASELNRASVFLGECVYRESDLVQNLQKEIKSLKDVNKSMALYIEKILNRIMEEQGFENILSSEWKPSSPVSPTMGSCFNNLRKEENKPKKIERRMTWHFRSLSQPQNNVKVTNDGVVTPNEGIKNTRRFSLFGWN